MSTTIDIESTSAPETQTMALEPAKLQAVAKQESYADLMGLAKELVATGFLPQAVKTPGQAVAIILTGRELGLPPMQALRSICIIQGKPELAADLQLSLFKRSGGQARWISQTSEEASLWLKHPNGDEFTQLFTMVDAKRAGLAGGMNWQKYPQAMLRSRAITAGLKSLGFEPLCGCYAPGEIGGPELVEHHDTDKPAAPTPPMAKPAIAPSATLPARETKPAVFADKATRDRMIQNLDSCRDLALEYFRKLADPAVLLDNEDLKDIPLQYVPVTKRQFDALMSAITEFGNGDEIRHAFPPNPIAPPAKSKPVEVPRDKATDAPGDQDAWRVFPMPWGKAAGVPLGELEKSYLFGLWANYKVETEYKGKPKKPETIAKDETFRAMLDLAGKHYEFKTP